MLIVALYLFFDRTLSGKALRATSVNRLGARLVGIGTTQAGRLAFTLAAGLGALSGILVAPLTTDLLRLGLPDRPEGLRRGDRRRPGQLSAGGAGGAAGGLLESFSSFWASAYKEVIVFTLIIPVLLWRSCAARAATRTRSDALGASCRPLPALLAALRAAAAAGLLPPYWVRCCNYIGLSSIVAIGLVLLTGIGGMTTFGQAGFVGIGAYTTAYLTTQYGVSPWLALPARLVVTAVVALLLGAVTLRLSGHFLPLGTIAWGLALFYLFGNLDLLGKYDGINGIPALNARACG